MVVGEVCCVIASAMVSHDLHARFLQFAEASQRQARGVHAAGMVANRAHSS